MKRTVAVLALGPGGLLVLPNTGWPQGGLPASNVLGQGSFTTSTAATTQSGMNLPVDALFDAGSSRLFVTNFNNNRVLVFDLSGGITTGMNASFVLGQGNFTSGGSATTQSRLKGPIFLALAPATSRLFVADAANNRVLVFDLAGGITTGMNASFVLGQADFTSGGASTSQSRLSSPRAPAYHAATNRLFVADSGNNRVLVFDLAGLTNGMNASVVLGQANFTSSGASTTQSRMNAPFGLAIDPVGSRLFVTDQSNLRVLVFDLAGLTNGMNASFVLGQANFTSSGSATTASGFNGPIGLAFDSATGRLFVGDSGNRRVLLFDISAGITNGMSAQAVLGQANFTTSGAATTQTGLNNAFGLGLDATLNRLFVADENNNRVMAWNLLRLTTTALPGGTVGVPYAQTLGTAGGGSSVTFSLNSSLPPGLALGSSTGTISGTPTSAGTFSFTIRATDQFNFTARRGYSLSIASAPPPSPPPDEPPPPPPPPPPTVPIEVPGVAPTVPIVSVDPPTQREVGQALAVVFQSGSPEAAVRQADDSGILTVQTAEGRQFAFLPLSVRKAGALPPKEEGGGGEDPGAGPLEGGSAGALRRAVSLSFTLDPFFGTAALTTPQGTQVELMGAPPDLARFLALLRPLGVMGLTIARGHFLLPTADPAPTLIARLAFELAPGAGPPGPAARPDGTAEVTYPEGRVQAAVPVFADLLGLLEFLPAQPGVGGLAPQADGTVRVLFAGQPLRLRPAFAVSGPTPAGAKRQIVGEGPGGFTFTSSDGRRQRFTIVP